MAGSEAEVASAALARREAFRAELGPGVRFSEPLCRHTSFRIGGPADVFFLAPAENDLRRALRVFTGEGMPILVLGGGTNVLVSDRGVRGAVVKLGKGFSGLAWTDGAGGEVELRAGGAARLALLATEAARRRLTGLEFAEGIPGSVGGAMVMNAGAFGAQMSSVVAGVEGMSFAGKDFSLTGGELQFRYRQLELPTASLVTAARFRLRRSCADQARRRVAEIRSLRRAAQPLNLPNAGSVFKNPPGDSAGRLIEAAGLKGLREGAAEVSQRHGNFIVNLGDAAAADVAALMERVRADVLERFGVSLELEVKLVGEW